MSPELEKEYNEFVVQKVNSWLKKYGDLFGRTPENIMFLEASFTKQFFLKKLEEMYNG